MAVGTVTPISLATGESGSPITIDSGPRAIAITRTALPPMSSAAGWLGHPDRSRDPYCRRSDQGREETGGDRNHLIPECKRSSAVELSRNANLRRGVRCWRKGPASWLTLIGYACAAAAASQGKTPGRRCAQK
jgi:hypothetical protein